jgi:hypothetical protein
MSVIALKADTRQRIEQVCYVPVLGPDSCSTLLSSIEIIKEFEKGAGYDEARAPVDRKGQS